MAKNQLAPAAEQLASCDECGEARDPLYGDTNDRPCYRCRSAKGKVAELHLAIGMAESENTAGPHHPVEEQHWAKTRKLLIQRHGAEQSDGELLSCLINKIARREALTRNDVFEMPLSDLPALAKSILTAQVSVVTEKLSEIPIERQSRALQKSEIVRIRLGRTHKNPSQYLKRMKQPLTIVPDPESNLFFVDLDEWPKSKHDQLRPKKTNAV